MNMKKGDGIGVVSYIRRWENRIGERIWGETINIKYLLKATQEPITL